MSLKQLLSEVREAVDARKRVFPVPTELIPDTITASARRIDCGQGCSRTFLIVGYPGEVPLGWTQALIDCAARVDVACHLGPVDTAVAVARIRRRRARLESSRRHAANRDQLDDPAVEAAAADAADLAGRLATGDTRMYAIGVYVTVHAEDPEALEIACGRLVAQSAAAMLDARPASWRQLPGVTSTLPLGVDALGATRTLDSDSAAAAFPLIDPDTPPTDTGVLYGLNLHTGAAVVWDRWACDNHNAVVVGSSGSGKSYFAKSEALRQLYEGVEVSVIDPDGEYADLAGYVDGTVITPGAAGVGLNPLELPADPAPDALTRRIMFASTMAETLIGEALDPDATAALDDAACAAFAAAGITDTPATWHLPAPTLGDVYHQLTEATAPAAAGLAARLAPYIGPRALSDVLTTPPAKSGSSPLTVYQLDRLPDELLAAVTLAVLDRVWSGLVDDGTRRLIVVDESWLLLRTGPGADYLAKLAKSARKRRAGLTCVTQDAEDLSSSELGRVVIANASTAVLMRQSSQAIDMVSGAFGLTDAEAGLVATARRGEGLLRSGDVHVGFSTLASAAEDALMRTGLSADLDDAAEEA